ncbi:hypothetical protein ETB97_005968 [Aspergillus alliaceus]|uniref:Uncharacterized protein n=1 Tax=Petromyces alliaceus TaxID=209559 RepID=A0A8H5ZXY3_PETAA|nr:hypothetical protein ETB97_005968 [Aspergillus burnettii]
MRFSHPKALERPCFSSRWDWRLLFPSQRRPRLSCLCSWKEVSSRYMDGLEKHDACSTIDHVIDKIGTSTDILAYFSSGYYSTLRVCKRMGGSNCYDAALAIGSIFISIAYIVGLATGAYSSNKRDSTRSLAGYLESALRAEGEIFDSIDDMSHTLQARDDSADGQIEIASVRN